VVLSSVSNIYGHISTIYFIPIRTELLSTVALNDDSMEQTADAIDDLLTVDVGGRGVIGELSAAAYEYHERSPPMEAAERLFESVSPGDDVIIVTGFLCPPTAQQETDGPVGAASLARAIAVGLGAHPTIMAEQEALPMVEAAARAYGLNIGDRDAVHDGTWTCSMKPILSP
jgi:hypothetical protein